MKLLKTKAKITKQWINVTIVIAVFILGLTLLFYTIGDIIYTQAREFMDTDWESIVVSIRSYIEENAFLQGVLDKILASLETLGKDADIVVIQDIFKGVVSVVITIVLVPVFLVFILNDRDAIFTGLLNVLPRTKKEHARELAIRANDVVEKYFNGKFLSMFIVGLLFTIVLLIFGFSLDKAIFFGFTLGFLDIIPYIGGFVGILLPVLYSFTITGSVLFGQYAFIGLISINLVLQFLQGNVIQPLIMGKEVNLHPLLVLSSFIFFGALFGITGVILAIPITGTIKATALYYKEVNNG